MNPTDIFWLFLIVIALQPLFRQKALEFARRRCLVRLEKMRSSRVIILVHRQETMALLGFPIFRFIDINDSEEVIRAIHLTDPEMPVDLILHTPGGLVLASLQIAWIFFLVTTALVLGVVAYLWWRLPESHTLGIIGYGLIFAGAVGNFIDRVRLGEVIDFFDFHLGRYHWPAFNVADSLICLGAGFLLWFIFQEEKKSNVPDSL